MAKAPTLLVVPSGNSTLSSTPLGLQRYTGEQDFVLLELELNESVVGSSSVSVTGVPYPDAAAANGVSGA